ncbi:MAG: hypothetical protein KGQ49_05425 [Verrucomicrobia bacterium]|nr:hypothetical protein [Verrucomicrobiota bacterium]MBU6446820.1 hypothetical protein [Verrucomicrobiota bacterium]MDE3048192.1 hypothetical protein [Verrucomicrobiota bacterium]
MFKYVTIFAACLLGSQLSADIIGDVEVQFPPSNYEWQVLIDQDYVKDLVPYCPTEEMGQFQVLTHREGDAFEIFIALQAPVDEEEDEEDCESESLACCQQEINEQLNRYLPNHQFVLLNLNDSNNEGTLEYALYDRSVDLMHGYARHFQKDGTSIFLLYQTTALASEYNKAIWTRVLNEAH